MDRWIMGYYGASFESLSIRKHGQGNNAAIFLHLDVVRSFVEWPDGLNSRASCANGPSSRS